MVKDVISILTIIVLACACVSMVEVHFEKGNNCKDVNKPCFDNLSCAWHRGGEACYINCCKAYNGGEACSKRKVKRK